MALPFISVIVPVYNSERYLNRCVESILSQTFSDFEIILIDDGSTDNSGSLCDSFSKKDQRVRVIHSRNEGAGASRNKGIVESIGEYLVFVDSDDYLHKTYFERLSSHNEDVVFIDIDDVDSKGNVKRHEHLSMYSTMDFSDFIKQQMTGKIPWGGVRKCVKRKIVIENAIRYSNNKTGEEAIYSFLISRLSKTVGFIEGVCYYCQLHSDSLSQRKGDDDPLIGVATELRDVVIKRGDYEEYGSTVNAFFMVSAFASMLRMAQNHKYFQFRNLAIERVHRLSMEIDSEKAIERQCISRNINAILWLMEKRMWMLIWIAIRIKS